MALRLGIDTGGTYTDAVLLNDANEQLVAKAKALTTRHNLIVGISGAIAAVLQQAADAGRGSVGDIHFVSLSTTLATNSIVEGHGAVAALILAGYRPSQLLLADLQHATRGMSVQMIDGGHDAGGYEAQALDMAQMDAVIDELPNEVAAVAVSSLFSVRNPAHELAIAERIRTRRHLAVTCGHQLSAALNAPRRALTALLNARLVPLIEDLIAAVELTLKQYKIVAPLMVVRGDGTLVSAPFAARNPVETILSGPAASVIGAQHLVGKRDMLVSDIGGTTTDIAIIRDGEPRSSANGASVNGWRTMVEAVQIDTHGLGGDSEIKFDRESRQFAIGPGKVMPLCTLASLHPHTLDTLQQFVEEPWVKTNMARFIVLRREPWEGLRLTAQQADLVAQVKEHPESMQSVFAERHFNRAMLRLIEIGVLTLAGFTPTDAAHVCGLYDHWPMQSSVAGANLLRRYSEYNLGRSWPDETAFCRSMLDAVSRDTALHLLTSVMNEQDGQFARSLNLAQRQLLRRIFVTQPDSELRLRAELDIPVVGIGAPAQCFYPALSNILDCEVLVPPDADVANAIGAVVGKVRQRVQIVITPVTNKRVMVHAGEQQREFDNLQLAASWATEMATGEAMEKARLAGGSQLQCSVEQHDNIVEKDGETTFFESRIVATVSGRAMGYSDG